MKHFWKSLFRLWMGKWPRSLQSNTTYFCHSMGKSKDNPQMYPSAKNTGQQHKWAFIQNDGTETLLCDAQYNRSSQISDHTRAQQQSEAHGSLWLCHDVSLAWLCPLISYRAFHTDNYLQWQSKRKSFILNQSLCVIWGDVGNSGRRQCDKVKLSSLWCSNYQSEHRSTDTVSYSRQTRTTNVTNRQISVSFRVRFDF